MADLSEKIRYRFMNLEMMQGCALLVLPILQPHAERIAQRRVDGDDGSFWQWQDYFPVVAEHRLLDARYSDTLGLV